MGTWKWVALLAAMLFAGCGTQRDAALTPERAAAVDGEVRAFADNVAHDVTQDGPAAWRKHFSESPAFFMAADGHLQFADSASATAGIQGLTRAIKHIELKWSDVRVDALTAELASMGAGWHEAAEMSDGKRMESDGYFTGIAERRDGRWRFRNAHWSVASASPVVR